jgi:hypothetical protein
MKENTDVNIKPEWRIHNPFYLSRIVRADSEIEALQKLIPEYEPVFVEDTIGYGKRYFIPIDPPDAKPQVRNYWTVMLKKDYVPEENWN